MHTADRCLACRSTDSAPFCTAIDRVRRLAEPVWQILRCNGCGFGWTWPPLNEDEIAGHYPSIYLGDTARTLEDFFSGKLLRSRSWRGEVEKAELVRKYLSGGNLLDVGCGDGKFLWAMDPREWRRTGLEFSSRTVALVRDRMPELQLIDGSLDSSRLSEASFDAITFWHVFEHLPDPERNLLRVFALLKPGGWIFISLPRFDSLQARLFRKHWYPFDDVPRHLYHFSRRSIELLLEKAGFRVVSHEFFSHRVNFHSLKHSLLNWSLDRSRGRTLYYLLKPTLFAFPLLEQISGKYGMLTTVARKPGQVPPGDTREL